MGATDSASFPGQQSGPTQPVQVSKKTRVSPFIPPPPPPPLPRLGERVLSCGFFPAEYEIGFLLGPSNDAKFSSLLTLHLLRGQAFPSYLYVGFLSRYNGSSPGWAVGGVINSRWSVDLIHILLLPLRSFYI